IDGAATLDQCLRDRAVPSDNSEDRAETFRPDTRHRPFEPARAAAVALRIALGLQAIHERGFLHCGLNSRDVIITEDDMPKIDNFTACRRIGELGASPEWVLPNYLPPELIVEDGATSPATDMYSLGALLYDMLVGLPPFVAPDALQTRDRVMHEAPR